MVMPPKITQPRALPSLMPPANGFAVNVSELMTCPFCRCLGSLDLRFDGLHRRLELRDARLELGPQLLVRGVGRFAELVHFSIDRRFLAQEGDNRRERGARAGGFGSGSQGLELRVREVDLRTDAVAEGFLDHVHHSRAPRRKSAGGAGHYAAAGLDGSAHSARRGGSPSQVL